MFKLSRRKGSSLWQVRKRWPQDVAAILRGEFTRSTGESDWKRAQERLPLLAAEYEAQVKAARDRLADNTLRDLSEPEMHRLAAAFYRDSLPAYRVRNAVSPAEQESLLRESRARVGALTRMLGRKEFAPVAGIARSMIGRERLPVSEDSPSLPALQALLMRAFIELHRGVIAQLEGANDYRPTDPVVGELAETSDKRTKTIADLIDAYKADKEDSWSQSTKSAYEPVWRLLRDVLGNTRDLSTITRDDGRKPGVKPIKLSDGKGLFLLIQPTGGKLWRLKYRIAGKEKKLALGRYPDVSLKDARERCDSARKLIAAGVDCGAACKIGPVGGVIGV